MTTRILRMKRGAAAARFVPLIMLALLTASCGSGSDLGFGCPGADPPPSDVSGTWEVSSPTITQSTCSSSINTVLLAAVQSSSGGPCDIEVQQNGVAITTHDCNGNNGNGCVSSDDQLSVSETLTLISQGCTFLASTLFTADSSKLEDSTARYQFALTFQGGGCGVLTNCTAVIDTAWNKLLE